MAHYFIINTGGTIGMTEGPHGLTPNAGEIESAMQSHPSLQAWHEHELSWYHWSPLLDSSDLEPRHWYRMAQTIWDQKNIDGVLIIHGTDTLAYTSAALSYLLSELTLPVVITGSMLPISAANTDAITNLQLALQALQTTRPEVMVAVGDQVLPGSRVTKFSTEKIASFCTPGWQSVQWQETPVTNALRITNEWQQPNIMLLNLYPGLTTDPIINSLTKASCQALLINAYGNGNLPDNPTMRRLLEQATEQSIPVFVHSQCLEGNVDFGLYAASALFTEHGAISCGMMPIEAALTKLQILCSESTRAEQIISGFLQPVAREWQNYSSHN